MKNLNKIQIIRILVAFLFMLFATESYSQRYKFYIEVNDPNTLPTIVQMKVDSTLELSNFHSNEIEGIFGNYNIYLIEQSFPTARNPFLKRIYTIEVNDLQLYADLLNNFPLLFPYAETIEEPILLHTPNDYGIAYDLTNLDLINAKAAWDITTGSPDVVIGIVDTRIQTTHEDISDQIIGIIGSNTINDFHGVAVAGCAAAKTNNSVGISSIGYNSKILFNTNWAKEGHKSMLILSQMGAKVLNASWISECFYSPIGQAIYTEIYENGTVVCAGAGNVATASQCGSLNAYVYPASYDHVLSVTSVGHKYSYGHVDRNNWKDVHVRDLNNSSTAHHHNDKVDICAPGYAVPTTWVDRDNNFQETYTTATGTSFASPTVAGVCALLFAVNPCLTPDDVEYIIKSTAANIYNIPENEPYIGLLGAGRIDAGAAVALANEYYIDVTNEPIEGVTAWNLDKRIKGVLNIENGGILTITSKVQLTEGSKIIIKRGGKLILDGGTLTSNCMWEGIDVLGNKIEAQSANTHGWCEVKNNGKIENARIAIRSYAGGIVRITGGKFYNNRYGISFNLYSLSNNNMHINLSVVANSQFICDRPMKDATYVDNGVREGSKSFVSIAQQDGIRVNNNEFISTYLPRADLKGTGVVTWSSRSYIHNNDFIGLTYGIESAGYLNALQSNSIYGNDFDGVSLGITETAMAGSRIGNNSIILPVYESNPWLMENYGINLNISKGFNVSDNFIKVSSIIDNANTYGVLVKNSHNIPCKIEHNFFRKLEFANQLEGDNDVIDIKCNQYNQSTQDWSINPINVGVFHTFGDDESQNIQAANFFPDNEGGSSARNIRLNDLMALTYYSVSAPDSAIPLDVTENVLISPISGTEYNEECEASFNPCGGNPIPCVAYAQELVNSNTEANADIIFKYKLNLAQQFKDSGMLEELRSLLEAETSPEWSELKLPIYIEYGVEMNINAQDTIENLPAGEYKNFMQAILNIKNENIPIDSLGDIRIVEDLLNISESSTSISAAAKKILELFYDYQYVREAERWEETNMVIQNNDTLKTTTKSIITIENKVVNENLINEKIVKPDFLLIPNPNNGNFQVKLISSSNGIMFIIDMQGKIIRKVELINNEVLNIEKESIAPGIYNIRFINKSDSYQLNKRVVILD